MTGPDAPPDDNLEPGCRWVKVTPDNVDDIVMGQVREEMQKIVNWLAEEGATEAQLTSALAQLRPFFTRHANDLRLSLLAPQTERPN